MPAVLAALWLCDPALPRLSCCLAAVAGGTYLFALPASPEVCRATWDTVLAPQLDNRTQPHNLVEILLQLTETRPPSARLLPEKQPQRLDEVDPQDAARFRLR